MIWQKRLFESCWSGFYVVQRGVPFCPQIVFYASPTERFFLTNKLYKFEYCNFETHVKLVEINTNSKFTSKAFFQFT